MGIEREFDRQTEQDFLESFAFWGVGVAYKIKGVGVILGPVGIRGKRKTPPPQKTLGHLIRHACACGMEMQWKYRGYTKYRHKVMVLRICLLSSHRVI